MNRQFPTYLLSVSLCSFPAYFAPKTRFVEFDQSALQNNFVNSFGFCKYIIVIIFRMVIITNVQKYKYAYSKFKN